MTKLLSAMLMTLPLCSCLAVGAASAVGGAAIHVAGDVAEAGVNTAGAVVGAAIPGRKHHDDRHDGDDNH
jgi:hypothetical protein